MLRTGLFAAFFVVLALGADNQPNTKTEAVVAHDEDIIPLHSSIRETTLIVLPAAEKAMGVFCGDKTYWNVDVIPGAERYVAVKPSKTGITSATVLANRQQEGSNALLTTIAEQQILTNKIQRDALASNLNVMTVADTYTATEATQSRFSGGFYKWRVSIPQPI